MNSRNDSLPNLIAYIRHQVVEFFEPFTIKLRIITPESIPEIVISGETRRNIVLAVKEALHNIIKHANATNVEVHFNLANNLEILICDNGTGIDPREIQHHNNGLRNMEERMKAIGGDFTLGGEMGTIVTFLVPISQRL
jgi:signal transduction histidine kinase